MSDSVEVDGKTKITVDDFLDNVDYHQLENYKPSAFAIEFISFLKIISSGMDMNPSPPVHYKMVDGLTVRRQYLANLCARGLSKTTVFGEILILYLAVFRHLPNFGLVDSAIYVADSMENGARSLRKNIQARYEKSSYLQSLIPDAKFTDSYIEFKNTDGDKFAVKLFGAKTGIRGIKIFGNRPKLAILDDLVSDEDAGSPTILQKIEDTIMRGILPALDPNKRKVIWNGTPFNKSDPLYRAIESGGWHVNVYPICEKFPCSRKEFKGAWEDRFGYDAIKDQYDVYVSMGQIKSFRQELMLRIASEEDRVIHDDDIRWFSVNKLMENPERYNFYITTDFATSTARKADYTVIGVWAVDSQKNRYLVDGMLGRQLMSETFKAVFKYVEKYNPISVGIEASGQQGGFISLFREEMRRRDTWFTVAKPIGSNREGIAVRTNKMERFRITEVPIKSGKFHLPLEIKNSTFITEILDELSMVTIDGIKSTHDDAIDMISQLDQIHIIYPEKQQASFNTQPELQVMPNPYSNFNGSTLTTDDEDDIDYSAYLA